MPIMPCHGIRLPAHFILLGRTEYTHGAPLFQGVYYLLNPKRWMSINLSIILEGKTSQGLNVTHFGSGMKWVKSPFKSVF
jgi:hypothetical protein